MITSDWLAQVSPTLDTYYGDKMGLEDQHIFNQRGGKFVPAPIAFNSREDPEVTWDRAGALGSSSPQSQAVAFAQNTRDEVRLFGGDGKIVGALAAEPGMKQQSYVAQPVAVAFDMRGREGGAQFEGPHDTANIRAASGGSSKSYVAQPAVTWSIMPQNSGKDYKARQVDVAQPLMAGGPVGGNQGGDYIQQSWAVRRLTPTECERLQGFPDNFTNVPWGKKDTSPDGPRYKALGNSFAVNVVRWIGQRIQMVEDICGNS